MLETYDMKKFGLEMKKIRLEAGLSQKNICDQTMISVDTLRRIENGYVVPRYDTIVILSSIYRFDILELFKKFATDTTLLKYYNQMDTMILDHDYRALNEMTSTLKNIEKNSINEGDIVYYNELSQLIIFMETNNSYFNDKNKNLIELKDRIIEGIKIRHREFTLEKLHELTYSFIELRLIILLSFTFINIDLDKSTNILVYLYKMLKKKKMNEEEKKLQLKIIYNLSYNYFMLDKELMSLEFANLGIKIANKFYLSYMLAPLYARKGIAMYYLKQDDYKKYLEFSFSLFEMEGRHESAKQFKKIFEEKHGIKF